MKHCVFVGLSNPWRNPTQNQIVWSYVEDTVGNHSCQYIYMAIYMGIIVHNEEVRGRETLTQGGGKSC